MLIYCMGVSSSSAIALWRATTGGGELKLLVVVMVASLKKDWEDYPDVRCWRIRMKLLRLHLYRRLNSSGDGGGSLRSMTLPLPLPLPFFFLAVLSTSCTIAQSAFLTIRDTPPPSCR